MTITPPCQVCGEPTEGFRDETQRFDYWVAEPARVFAPSVWTAQPCGHKQLREFTVYVEQADGRHPYAGHPAALVLADHPLVGNPSRSYPVRCGCWLDDPDRGCGLRPGGLP